MPKASIAMTGGHVPQYLDRPATLSLLEFFLWTTLGDFRPLDPYAMSPPPSTHML